MLQFRLMTLLVPSCPHSPLTSRKFSPFRFHRGMKRSSKRSLSTLAFVSTLRSGYILSSADIFPSLSSLSPFSIAPTPSLPFVPSLFNGTLAIPLTEYNYSGRKKRGGGKKKSKKEKIEEKSARREEKEARNEHHTGQWATAVWFLSGAARFETIMPYNSRYRRGCNGKSRSN